MSTEKFIGLFYTWNLNNIQINTIKQNGDAFLLLCEGSKCN